MGDFVVRMRGLPWSATANDIINFFDSCNLAQGESSVHLTQTRDGRPSGEAYVEFASEEDVENALTYDKKNIGSRYIEVFRSSRSGMNSDLRKSGGDEFSSSDSVVRLRGLPFKCSKEEITEFFSGLQIVSNGILLPLDESGRSSGDAFVQFASNDYVELALEKNKEKIGHRYIEIFRSSKAEALAAARHFNPSIPSLMTMRGGGGGGGGGYGRPGPYDRSSMIRPGRGRGNIRGYGDYDDMIGGGYGRPKMGGGMRPGGGFGMGGYMGMGGGGFGGGKKGHFIHMRGLPFKATEDDVYNFFSPYNPIGVEFGMDRDGRRSGEADAEFETHADAKGAMSKDKSNMGSRYIELFLESEPDAGKFGMGGGYGGGLDSGANGFGAAVGYPSLGRNATFSSLMNNY